MWFSIAFLRKIPFVYNRKFILVDSMKSLWCSCRAQLRGNFKSSVESWILIQFIETRIVMIQTLSIANESMWRFHLWTNESWNENADQHFRFVCNFPSLVATCQSSFKFQNNFIKKCGETWKFSNMDNDHFRDVRLQWIKQNVYFKSNNELWLSWLLSR